MLPRLGDLQSGHGSTRTSDAMLSLCGVGVLLPVFCDDDTGIAIHVQLVRYYWVNGASEQEEMVSTDRRQIQK